MNDVQYAVQILCIASLAFTVGCKSKSYGTEGCRQNQPEPIADFSVTQGKTDVTFIAFGDTQEGGGAADKNDIQIAAINSFTEHLTWDDAGRSDWGDISDIRGIIMAGDITQNGRDGRGFEVDEYGGFTKRYGLCGNKNVRYHMYEGYGNHDFYEWNNVAYGDGEHPIADSVAIRNGYRPGLVNQAPGMDGHYSWDWDNIHFIQLNLTPSNVEPDYADGYTGLRNPRKALEYFERDLQLNVAGTSKKVIFVAHYGPWETFEWDQAQIDRLCTTVTQYRSQILGYIHGHAHATQKYSWCGIPIFNVGSPYYQNYNSDSRGRFTVFRVKEDSNGNYDMTAADVSWSPSAYHADKSGDYDLKIKNWNRFPFTQSVPPH